jgi:hypothetical protein
MSAEGYRWVKFDCPYACATKEDLLEITRDPSDLNELHIELHMVEGVRAYLLIQGSIFGDHYVHGMEGVSADLDRRFQIASCKAPGHRCRFAHLPGNTRPVRRYTT